MIASHLSRGRLDGRNIHHLPVPRMQDPGEFTGEFTLAARRIAARFGLEPSVASLLADLARLGPREAA